MKTKILSILLAAALLLSMMPMVAFAQAEEMPTLTATYVNPVYEGMISPEQFASPGISLLSDIVYHTDFNTPAPQMRAALESRAPQVTIGFQIPVDSFNTETLGEITDGILEAIFAHTGVPTQGDYLRWHFGYTEIAAQASGQNEDRTAWNTDITFYINYYTTNEQEEAVSARVDALLTELNPTGTDYEKLKTVYDWMCDNIVYDYANLPDPAYILKYSAYAALINGTSVCQGYANLLYRLALEMGIDCRIITGKGNGGDHAWNIIKLGDSYYNLDATWDSAYPTPVYFLRCQENFGDHSRSAEYNTPAFHASYPMSESDYDSVQDHTHNYTAVVTAPTCTEKGYTTYTCACGHTYTADEKAALGHTEETVTGTAATCTDTGLTDGKKCSVCGTVTKKQETIAALGHKWNDGEVTKEPTESTTGVRTYTCTVCGETKTEDIPVLEHTHNYESIVTAPTCTEKGYTTYTCACGHTYTADEKAALGHTEETVTGTAATCTDTGLTDGKKCSVCGTVTKKQETIAALGHKWNDGEVTKEPTESATGVRTYTCTVCGETRTEEIPMLEHTHKYEAKVTAPTCTEKGYTTYTCACGYSYTADEKAALGHTEETVTGTAATCTDTGLTDGKKCSVCGTVTKKQETIAALGHKIACAVSSAPTVDTEGTLHVTCVNCDKDEMVTLPKLNKTDYSYEVTKEPTTEATGTAKYTWNVTDYGVHHFKVTLDKLPDLSEIVYGDINDDGKVTILDLMRLANHFANGVEINEASADVNGDGKVTILDLMRLANYFAGNATLG